MKNLFIYAFLILALFAVSVGVKAIANPAPTYCAEMGYTVVEENCVFPDGQKCEQWAFYNGGCGLTYRKALACAKSGESLLPGHECCAGLTSIAIKTLSSGGVCPMMVGAWPICAPCGNGVCDSAVESECNCSKDCSNSLPNCGDGICQNVTCMAMGCPIAENAENCPKDCKICPAYSAPLCKVDEMIVSSTVVDANGCLGPSICVKKIQCPVSNVPTCKGDEILVGSTIIDSNGCPGPVKCVKKTENCQAGCVCNGNITSCPTITKPVESEIKVSNSQQNNLSEGSTITEPISIKKDGNKFEITVGSTKISTSADVSVQESKLYLNNSNGINSEIKIMPETASLKAIEKLGQVGFTIELKEVGQKPTYVLTGEKDVKILWMIKNKMKVSAEISAETGDVIKITKPWWSFLAK